LIKFFHDAGVTSLSFKALNRHLQKENQPQLTYELLSLMFDEDPRLQSLITSISSNTIKLGKKTNNSQLAKSQPSTQTQPPPPSQPTM
jgi:septation ring formation regulator EzrA